MSLTIAYIIIEDDTAVVSCSPRIVKVSDCVDRIETKYIEKECDCKDAYDKALEDVIRAKQFEKKMEMIE